MLLHGFILWKMSGVIENNKERCNLEKQKDGNSRLFWNKLIKESNKLILLLVTQWIKTLQITVRHENLKSRKNIHREDIYSDNFGLPPTPYLLFQLSFIFAGSCFFFFFFSAKNSFVMLAFITELSRSCLQQMNKIRESVIL